MILKKIQFTSTLLYSSIVNDFLEHLLIYRMQNSKVQKCKIQGPIAKYRNIAKGTTDPRVEFISQDYSSQFTNLEKITISDF